MTNQHSPDNPRPSVATRQQCSLLISSFAPCVLVYVFIHFLHHTSDTNLRHTSFTHQTPNPHCVETPLGELDSKVSASAHRAQDQPRIATSNMSDISDDDPGMASSDHSTSYTSAVLDVLPEDDLITTLHETAHDSEATVTAEVSTMLSQAQDVPKTTTPEVEPSILLSQTLEIPRITASEVDDLVLELGMTCFAEVICDCHPPPSRLIDLPIELRNHIWGFCVGVNDEPIELAPQRWDLPNPKLIRFDDPGPTGLEWPEPIKMFKRRQIDTVYPEVPPANGPFSGSTWHGYRLMHQIAPMLDFLRTSKEIYAEASKAFYGREFRFTNEAGSLILAHFLEAIGPVHREQLRQVTVTHPVFVMGSADVPEFDWKLRHGLRDCAMSGAPLRSYGLDPSNIAELVNTMNPVGALLNLSQVKKLTFVVSSCGGGVFYTRLTEHMLASHEILRAALPKTEISFISLTSAVAGPSAHLLSKHAVNNIDLDRIQSPFATGLWDFFHAVGEAKVFFQTMDELNFPTSDVFYDNHYSYPADPEERCINVDICCHIIDHRDKHFYHYSATPCAELEVPPKRYHEQNYWDEEDDDLQPCDQWRFHTKSGVARFGSIDSIVRAKIARMKWAARREEWEKEGATDSSWPRTTQQWPGMEPEAICFPPEDLGAYHFKDIAH